MFDVARTSELMALLDGVFDQSTAARVSGSIAANDRHHQPWRRIHGRLYTTAIETFATTGADQAVKHRGQQAVRIATANIEAP